MSLGLLKMWFALGSMGLMFLAVIAIYISRYRLKNRFFKICISLLAYTCMVVSGVIVLIVVFSGPVND
ncbi:DUF2768 domain-containing protein [Bacillus sp. CLL-7-23]|uniref:DUF2768 domain-containing protein n=1 Tax=Bacillus changyiensis TaxID=3004103 RepID=A0ABT4X037_9BACI|nr:DUF2768 domain-containing protein [Bacillus changyiensis]MDA7025655.1 DUF2768 domain-containing protein [Bacillus changyiensis]